MPKVLHPVCGRPMVAWPVLAAREAGADRVAVIVSPDRDLTPGLPDGTETVVQPEADGTGGAIRAAHDLVRASDTVVVLSGDHPLITAEIVAALLETHRAAGAARHGDDRRARRPRRLRPHHPRRRRRHRADRRDQGPRPASRPRSSRSARSTPAPTRSPPSRWSARSTASTATTRRRVLHRRRPADAPREQGCASSPTPPRTRTSTSASTTAPTSRSSPPRPASQILERHMLAGVTIIDPRQHLDRRRGRDRAPTRRSSRAARCAARPRSAPTRSSARTPPSSTAGSAPRSRVLHSYMLRGRGRRRVPGRPLRLPAPRGRRSARAPRPAPSSRSRTRRSARARRCPHLSYVGDAEVGAGANLGAGTITANYDGFAQAPHEDRARCANRRQHLARGAGHRRRRRLHWRRSRGPQGRPGRGARRSRRSSSETSRATPSARRPRRSEAEGTDEA